MENIILNIGGKEYSAEFDKKDSSIVRINGNPYKIELLKSYGNNIFSFSINNMLKQIEIDLSSDNKSVISVDGFSYEIDITNETKKLLSQYILKTDGGANSDVVKVNAPMPGMVVKIHVIVGQSVSKGDKIIIIEAMKMENALSSPVSGIIKKIAVSEGTAVEKNALLMEIRT